VVEAILALQQAAGNRAVTGLMRPPEAASPGHAAATALAVARSETGRPLRGRTQAQMEAQFGRDFSGVRVHTGPRAADAARALHAKAYTVGQDVVFAEGEYAPGTAGGRELLAHELAHTVQQRGTTGTPPSPDPGGPQEASAATAAHQVAGGGAVSGAMPVSGVGLSRSPDTERFEKAFDDRELADELSRMSDKLQTPHYLGRDWDVRWYEHLQEEATRRAARRGEDPATAAMPAPSGDPARDAAIAEAYALMARMDAEEKAEKEQEARAQRAAEASWRPTPLLYDDPQLEDQQLTDETVFPDVVIAARIESKEKEKKEWWLNKALAKVRHTPQVKGQLNTFDVFKINEEFTRLYAELYLNDPETFKWAGMAAFASAEVGGGLRSAYHLSFGDDVGFGKAFTWAGGLALTGESIGDVTAKKLFWALSAGNRWVWADIYWQHLAYSEGGLSALERVNRRGELDNRAFEAWQKIDKGKRTNDQDLVWEGNAELLEYEQKMVLQANVYDQSRDIWKKISSEVPSPVPGHDVKFQDYVKGGDIGNFQERWKWIHESLLPAWRKLESSEPEKVKELLRAL
jgi:hypothetical protein